jgi:hypothetical protein
MGNISKDKHKISRFYLIIFLVTFILIIVKDKYIGSGTTFAMERPLNWLEIKENIGWYFIMSFLSAVLFSIVFINDLKKKK